MYPRICYICGTEFTIDDADDCCPYCDWMYVGWENEFGEDEKTEPNGDITIRIAKENYAKGLNIWGEPLPKVRPVLKDTDKD